MTVLHYIFLAFWFFLPAGIANMMPVFSPHVPLIKRWNYPMDFHATFRGHRVFGDHKTWRGLLIGIIFATLVLWLQQLASAHSTWLQAWTAPVEYAALPTLVMGPVFALGALLGDAIESFFKRQIGKKPGDGWFPFDQTDYIIGGAVATMPFVTLSVIHYIWLIVIWFGLHIVGSSIGYLLGVKDRPI